MLCTEVTELNSSQMGQIPLLADREALHNWITLSSVSRQLAQTPTVCAPFSIIIWVFPYPKFDIQIWIKNPNRHANIQSSNLKEAQTLVILQT